LEADQSMAADAEHMGGDYGFLSTGGELATRVAQFDWASTPIGPIGSWPHSLIGMVRFMLASPVPLVLLWGEHGVMIYNDAYSVFAGGRDSRLLGSNVREGWDEISDFNDNVMRVGLAGKTLSYRDHELTLHRDGKPRLFAGSGGRRQARRCHRGGRRSDRRSAQPAGLGAE
jgi:hypothetical protein